MKAVREIVLLISFAALPVVSFAQSPDPQAAKPSPSPPSQSFRKSLVRDQKAIWTSPLKLKKEDVRWLLPLTAATTGLIIADRHTSGWVDRNGDLQPTSHGVSFVGSAYVVASTAAGFYLFGHATHNPHTQQTGELMAEAVIGTAVVTEVLKFATGRTRPNEALGKGHFFEHGRSFLSGHSSLSWV